MRNGKTPFRFAVKLANTVGFSPAPCRFAAGEITRWFGTNTDITEQRAAEEALKESDRRKDEFIATLAHELRNPLAPLRNGLEILHLARNDPVAVERAQQMMDRQLTHMVRLIDDLLDLSRISRGIITLHKQRVLLNSVLEQAVETTRPAIEEASHHFSLDLPPKPLYVDGDPARLSQIFSNLLNNAAKFSERGASIWLKAAQQGCEIAITVRDTGIGIPVHMLDRIFDMFIQADSGLERASGGLGIGLSLVRGLVEKHSGRVEARSAGPSLGSEFVVYLPAAAPGEIQERHPEQARLCSRQRRRVLVVDDNRDAATSIAEVLELLGNETRTAYSGPDALELGGHFRPDLILLDIGMPKMSGYEVAQCIRQQEWGSDVVIVALTGWGQEEDRRRSRAAGFDHHLVKPVDLSDLQQILQHQDAR